MAVVTTAVDVFRESYACEVCGADMLSKWAVTTGWTTKYTHECANGHEVVLDRSYPRTVYVDKVIDVTAADKLSKLRKGIITIADTYTRQLGRRSVDLLKAIDESLDEVEKDLRGNPGAKK